MSEVTAGATAGARPASSVGATPRLILRFALYTSVGIALAAASLILFVRHFERGRAEHAATLHTALVAALVADELRSSDLDGAVTRERREARRPDRTSRPS